MGQVYRVTSAEADRTLNTHWEETHSQSENRREERTLIVARQFAHRVLQHAQQLQHTHTHTRTDDHFTPSRLLTGLYNKNTSAWLKLEMGKNLTQQERTEPKPRFCQESNRTRTQISWFLLLGSFTEWNCRYIHTFHSKQGTLLFLVSPSSSTSLMTKYSEPQQN